MRDLVETVIAQVMQQNKQRPQLRVDSDDAKTTFKSQFFKELNRKTTETVIEHHEVKDKALWDVSVKFEAIFFKQMMEAMRKTVPESGFLKHGFSEGVQESMFDQAISDAGSRSGSLGIAANIYRQLEQSKSHAEDGSLDSNKKIQAKEIQEIQEISDMEQMSMYTGLRGEIDGSH